MKAIALAVLAGLAVTNLALAEPRPAPAWELNDLEGEPHRLEEWRGKWVLMKLGTTVCPNCAMEVEELAKIEGQLAQLGVEVLDIYLREDRYTVKKYWKKKELGYQPTVLYDWKGGLIRSYGVSIIPHLFLVNPNGEIAWDGGYTAGPELLSIVQARLSAAQKP